MLAIVAIAARANRIFSNMALLLSLEALPASDFAGTYKEYHRIAEHPEANHSEIARALGVSRPTVIKWLKDDEQASPAD